ncbi:MAG: hypothetical protein AB8F95_06210 [Bacteroidia bacterium]
MNSPLFFIITGLVFGLFVLYRTKYPAKPRITFEVKELIRKKLKKKGFELIQVRVPTEAEWQDSPFTKPPPPKEIGEILNPAMRSLGLMEYLVIVDFRNKKGDYRNWLYLQRNYFSFKPDSFFWAKPLSEFI